MKLIAVLVLLMMQSNGMPYDMCIDDDYQLVMVDRGEMYISVYDNFNSDWVLFDVDGSKYSYFKKDDYFNNPLRTLFGYNFSYLNNMTDAEIDKIVRDRYCAWW